MICELHRFDSHTRPEACSDLEQVIFSTCSRCGWAADCALQCYPDNLVLFGTGSTYTQTHILYKHTLDTPKHWQEQLVPWDAIQVKSLSRCRGLYNRSAGNKPRPGSPVFTVCSVVMSECTRKNMLPRLSSRSNLTDPAPNHVKIYRHEFSVDFSGLYNPGHFTYIALSLFLCFIQVKTSLFTMYLLKGQFTQIPHSKKKKFFLTYS